MGNERSTVADATVSVCSGSRAWIEGAAVDQLHTAAKLDGMRLAVGMADLHPGRGHPIGAVFGSRGRIYPHLVGSDIGCGMSLWACDQPARKLKLDRVERRWRAMDRLDAARARDLVVAAGLPVAMHVDLATIGGGNHFAELQVVDAIFDEHAATGIGLRSGYGTLLVHSGSRRWGHLAARRAIDLSAGRGFADDDDAAQGYLQEHAQALVWARLNREWIAREHLVALGRKGRALIEVEHNFVERVELSPHGALWLHRKGAAPADRGYIVLPGSRGDHSYVLAPESRLDEVGRSLPHGAGRKYARSSASARVRGTVADLRVTALGSRVVCDDRRLMREEAPSMYKSIDDVVHDLVELGLARPVARLRPLVTYKTGPKEQETHA